MSVDHLREDIRQVLCELHEKRNRLIHDLTEVDRLINSIRLLDQDNHSLRTHIQRMNRRHHEGSQSHADKRRKCNSPSFSEDGEIY